MLRMRCSSDRLCSTCRATIHSGDEYYIGRGGNWICLGCEGIAVASVPSVAQLPLVARKPEITPEQKALKLVSELCNEYGLNLEIASEYVRAFDDLVNFKVTKHDMYLVVGGVTNCVHLSNYLTPYRNREGTQPRMPLADKLYSAIKWHLSESGVRYIRIGQTGGGNARDVREYLLSKVKTP